MQRAILHMDLDSFFVSVERLLDSRLRASPSFLVAQVTVAWSHPVAMKRAHMAYVQEWL